MIASKAPRDGREARWQEDTEGAELVVQREGYCGMLSSKRVISIIGSGS